MVDINIKHRWMARLILLLAVAGVATQAWSQTTMLVEPPTPLLPLSFGAWQAADGAPACRDCFEPEGQAAAVLKEDGLQRAARISYRREKGAGTLEVTAFQFVDATGAVSAFTFLREPGARTISSPEGKIGAELVVADGGDYIFRSGTTVVVANTSKAGASVVSDLRRLETTLPKIGGPKAQLPMLPTLLPQKGLQVDTVRYALGPVGYQAMGGVLPGAMVGFDKSAEVIMAKYAGRGFLTLLLYPTPQIAGDRGRAIVAEMNKLGPTAGTVKLRREGPLVLMTTGGWSPAVAQKTIEGIHLHNLLTWNKAMPLDFHSEVRKTVSLLTSIAILSGILMLAAILLGLFLGFGRAAIRVMQGKPAATEPEFLRIDLSGRLEKIHTESQEPESGG
ncbi:MAG: hypothetical protein BGO25_10600 [Acidobacteriales bacterium 59-55]|nr:hypothetical protein [Terriglobales bacterium]OJV43632.1 MAG: hypothetical protein BGO25_10600 [Acidobacteriales bacterium 59-55]